MLNGVTVSSPGPQQNIRMASSRATNQSRADTMRKSSGCEFLFAIQLTDSEGTFAGSVLMSILPSINDAADNAEHDGHHDGEDDNGHHADRVTDRRR